MLKKLLIPLFGIVALAVLSGIALAGVPCSGTSTIVVTENSAACTGAAAICPAGDKDTLRVEVTVMDCYGTALSGKSVTLTPISSGFKFRAVDNPVVLSTDVLGKVAYGYRYFGGCGSLQFQAVVDGVTIGPSSAITIANFDNNAVPSGKCDLIDLGIFGAHFGSTTWTCGDYNCSGKEDLVDLGIFGAHFGHQIP
jgi:hypothetical protein